ncbi:MAG: hypothetical protein ACRC9Y_15030 [Aeromonas veronii]
MHRLLIFILCFLYIPITYASKYIQFDSGITQYNKVDDVSLSYGGKFGILIFNRSYTDIYMEAGYKSFGNIETGSEKTKIDSYNSGMKFSLYKNDKIDILASIGGHYWKAKSILLNDDNIDLYYGLNIEKPLNEKVKLGLGYNKFLIFDEEISQIELRFIYLL